MENPLIVLARASAWLLWILPKGETFPRTYRTTLTQRLMDASLDFPENIIKAMQHSGSTRDKHLRNADANLANIRLYLRICWRWKWLSDGQYQHASRQVVELGKLLGGLRRKIKS